MKESKQFVIKKKSMENNGVRNNATNEEILELIKKYENYR